MAASIYSPLILSNPTPAKVLPPFFSHVAKSFGYFCLLKLFGSIQQNQFPFLKTFYSWPSDTPISQFSIYNTGLSCSAFFFFFIRFLPLNKYISQFYSQVSFIPVLYVYHVVPPISMTLNITYTLRHNF